MVEATRDFSDEAYLDACEEAREDAWLASRGHPLGAYATDATVESRARQIDAIRVAPVEQTEPQN